MSNKVTQLNDRTPFWGAKASPEYKYLQQILNNKNTSVTLNRNCFRELLKTLSKLVTKQSNNESLVTSLEFEERISALADQFQISSYHLTMIYASLFKLHRSALRMSSLKQEILKEDLIEFLKFPAEYATDFTSLVSSQKRENIDTLYFKMRPQLPTLKCVSWRVDVSISTSSLSRTLEPTILMQMHLSNGQKISFEMSINSFHLLRFNVAFVLKEIEDLLNRPTLKLPD